MESILRKTPEGKRRILLVSNRVMHYRVAVYNEFHRRFAELGWEWMVLTNEVQASNPVEPEFALEVMPFSFSAYRRRLRELKPDAVILFLHLKDRILWPLSHWMKLAGIPFAVWTKTRNLDDADNALKNFMFDHVHRLSDGIILYADELRENLPASCQKKAFAAPNTINPNAFPPVNMSPAEIKRDLDIPFEKVVLFVGRMDVDGGRKRVDYLIDIFRGEVPEGCGLVIVGTGMKPEWKERIDSRTTRFLGEVHDPENHEIARIFTMADVCAIPGHVGLGLNQAFLYGLPVVTLEGSQPPEIGYLHHGENGYIDGEGDVETLRRRIFHLLEDDGARARFSEAASRTFAEEASIENMFSGFRKSVLMMTGSEDPNEVNLAKVEPVETT